MTNDHLDILINSIDTIHRHLADDELKRYEIYLELQNVFDQDTCADALGDDPIFDKVYRECYLGEEDDDE